MCRWHLLNSGVYAADFCRMAVCIRLTFVEYSGVRAVDVCSQQQRQQQMVLCFGEWCRLCRLGARFRSGAHFPNVNRDSEVSRIDAK